MSVSITERVMVLNGLWTSPDVAVLVLDDTLTWADHIKNCRERGYSTEHEIAMAMSWRHCACKGLDPRIPRNETGSPRDRRLRELGIDFGCAIAFNRFDEAEALLVKIERRAEEVAALVDRYGYRIAGVITTMKSLYSRGSRVCTNSL